MFNLSLIVLSGVVKKPENTAIYFCTPPACYSAEYTFHCL